jgi:hypothetical protein
LKQYLLDIVAVADGTSVKGTFIAQEKFPRFVLR